MGGGRGVPVGFTPEERLPLCTTKLGRRNDRLFAPSLSYK